MSHLENHSAEIEKVTMFSEKVARVKEELKKDVVGQADIIDLVITENGAISRYIQPESHIFPGGKEMIIPATQRDVAEYQW